MRVAPQVRALAWLLDRTPTGDIASMSAADIVRARTGPPQNALTRLVVGRATKSVAWEDLRVPVWDGAEGAEGAEGAMGVRVYRPRRAAAASRPLVVYVHGGGWVLGNAVSAGWLCAGVAAELDAVVASVEYRLAPEHRAPTAARDCYEVTRELVGRAEELGADPARVAVMGDSAGGNLAAVVALQARDAGGPTLAAQVLIYPATDATLSSPSLARLSRAPMLDLADITAYRAHYLGPDGDPHDPLISPLLAPSLAGLPPALIQTAEHDPLIDDGLRYAQALRAAGVRVRYTEYVGVPHGFISIPGLTRAAHQARREIVEFLRSTVVVLKSGPRSADRGT